MHLAPVTDPAKGTSGPKPCHKKQPQCIRLGLCLTVVAAQEGAHLSFGSRHIRLQRLCSPWVKVLITPQHLRPVPLGDKKKYCATLGGRQFFRCPHCLKRIYRSEEIVNL